MYVVAHNAVSIDGRIDGFIPDIGLYYELTETWDIDAHLVGADTLIEGEQETDDASDSKANLPNEGDEQQKHGELPLLVVTDSKGRVSGWDKIRNQPHWSDLLVLCSDATSEEHLTQLAREGIPYVVAGEDHVDLGGALDELANQGVETVLVDSGGTLNGALLRSGLVDEVSILVHPELVGGTSARSFVRGPDPDDGSTHLDLLAVDQPAENVVWLRYGVTS